MVNFLELILTQIFTGSILGHNSVNARQTGIMVSHICMTIFSTLTSFFV